MAGVMGRILCIDYGLKRCGLAVTDPERIIATALATVEAHRLTDFLKDYLSKETVDTFVVGLPRNLDGSDTDATQPVRHFAGRLRRAFPGLPVVFADEQYSSVMAARALSEMGLGRRRRRDKGLVDRTAATLILMDYLQSRSGGAARG
jgi:putative Holliday junction resolvase